MNLKTDWRTCFACCCRDVFGDAAVVGDRRWGGGWGIDAELWARTKVSGERARWCWESGPLTISMVMVAVGRDPREPFQGNKGKGKGKMW
jgi:hypothetical protein